MRFTLIQWLVGWNAPEVAHRSGDPFISGPPFPNGTTTALMVLKSEHMELSVWAKRLRDACILSGDHDALDVSWEFDEWLKT